MTTTHMIQWSGGTTPNPDPAIELAGLSTDTRTLEPGQAYIALKGERFDGHDFIPQAVQRGARAIIASRPVHVPPGITLITVADTLDALKKIARGHRRHLGARVTAIAGSNGKTTVKEMTAAMLARRHKVTKTYYNNNNRIGVCITLLSARLGDEHIVCEIGTNAPGEIAELCQICEPDAVTITNINEEHLELLGDIEGVFREESAALEFLKEQSLAVLPSDDAFLPRLKEKCRCRALSAGFNTNSDFQILNWDGSSLPQKFTLARAAENHSALFTLPLPGRHMAANAALAAALANSCGIPLEECAAALADFHGEKGRLNIHNAAGRIIIDDTYNANPASMTQALNVLDSFPGRKIAVLGDMGELGPRAPEIHAALAPVIAASGADLLVAVGSLAQAYTACGKQSLHYPDSTAAASEIAKHTRAGDTILVKGSRFMRMENIVNALKN